MSLTPAMQEFKERIKVMYGRILTLPSEIIAEEKAKCEYLKKELDILTLMSDNTKNEFLKWIESNGNG